MKGREGKRREGKCMKGEMAQDVYNTVSLYRGHHWTQLAVLFREVSLNSEVEHSSMWLGLQTVSSLERSPLFRVPFIERFHCTYV